MTDMTENELMIGDWFLADGVAKQYEWTDYSPEEFGYCIDEYNPIPLTADILKANNIKLREKFVIPDEKWGDDTIIIIDSVGYVKNTERKEVYHVSIRHHEINIFEGGFIHMKIKNLYVHQLQHLLRDIGLKMFADNFKV